MKKSNQLEPDNFPWDLRAITGYQCPICFRTYTTPGWCPNQFLQSNSELIPHPQAVLRPDIIETDE